MSEPAQQDDDMRGYKGWLYLACMLFSVAFVQGAHAESGTDAVDITGSWLAEPELGQMGMIQSSYAFQADGAFRQKADFKSFCGRGAVKPDCEYFWTVSEGTYTLEAGVLNLQHNRMTSLLKYQGYAEPQRRDMGMRRMQEAIRIVIQGDRMILTDKKGRTLEYVRSTAPLN